MSAQEARDFYGGSDRDYSYFTPSPADIDAFQAGLGEFLATEPGAKRIVQTLAQYRGLFVGVVFDGRRSIRGVYSCQTHATCRDRSLMVFDGGDCFFDVEFDLETRSYKSLHINGVA